MINEFSVSPRPSNNKARHTFCIFRILAVFVQAVVVSPKNVIRILGYRRRISVGSELIEIHVESVG